MLSLGDPYFGCNAHYICYHPRPKWLCLFIKFQACKLADKQCPLPLSVTGVKLKTVAVTRAKLTHPLPSHSGIKFIPGGDPKRQDALTCYTCLQRVLTPPPALAHLHAPALLTII